MNWQIQEKKNSFPNQINKAGIDFQNRFLDNWFFQYFKIRIIELWLWFDLDFVVFNTFWQQKNKKNENSFKKKMLPLHSSQVDWTISQVGWTCSQNGFTSGHFDFFYFDLIPIWLIQKSRTSVQFYFHLFIVFPICFRSKNVLISCLGSGVVCGWSTWSVCVSSEYNVNALVRYRRGAGFAEKKKKLAEEVMKRPYFSAIDLYDEIAKKYPQSEAIRFLHDDGTVTSWTFRKLMDYSNQVANWAKAKGIKQGDYVGLLMNNRIEYPAIWLGLSRVGATTALYNINLKSKSLAACIKVF